MQNPSKVNDKEFIQEHVERIRELNSFRRSDYDKGDIKFGLRNSDGTGVLAGVSHICNVSGYYIQDGEKMPMKGKLTYRGINVRRLVEGCIRENRFGYEETIYLLLFGELPNKEQLESFNHIMSAYRALPDRFTESMILAAPSKDIMNKIARSILALYSYDNDPEPDGLEKELRQAMHIIARCPVIVAHSYAAKKHYYDNDSLYLHLPQDNLSLAENFLYSIRRDNKYTEQEAHLLDLCMILHSEHGGGNNSAFACRVLSSTGTDIYSSLSAAVGSLKGPRHGGANKKVNDMLADIKENVKNWADEGEIKDYLHKILRGEAADGSGLIYGLGHAIYTVSDPRAVTLKKLAHELAIEKGMVDEFMLMERIERLAPIAYCEHRDIDRVMCVNVDFYSGFLYRMLGIPEELYTPLFAMSRITGWCAHRIEELYNPNKIIRPAFKVISEKRDFVPLEER